MTTISDVVARRAPSPIFEDLLARASAKGLAARGYQRFRIARALLEIEADTASTGEEIVAFIATGGFPELAEGPWLDLVAAGWFDEFRNAPLTGIYQLRLTDSTGGGPYELSNPIAVAYPTTATPLYYRSQAGTITVPRNGSVDAIFFAAATGAIYNVAPGQIVDLATPIPGVSLTSPQIGSTGSITVSAGADVEIDTALRARLRDKWGTLGRGWMATTIRALVRQALAGVTLKLAVLDPGAVPGRAEVYAATTAGPISAGQALTAYQYLADPVRRPVASIPVGVYAAPSFVQALAVTLYLDGSAVDAASRAAFRLQAYQDALDLGSVIHASRLVDVFVSPEDGVIGAVLTNLAGVEFLNPGRTDAVEFVPTFTLIG